MGNVLVKEETLAAIADSIREKSGFSEKYKPAEMPNAIRNIPTSSSTEPNEGDPIRFYGYGGELVYSYSLEEIEAMTELPPFPEVEGMVCQEWNWTLEELKSHQREADVGAIYTTDDGSTRVYISLVEGALNPMVNFAQITANSVWVDWGDGSPLESSKKTGSTTPVEMKHQYASAGDYIIRLIPEENAEIYLLGDSKGTGLLRKVTSISGTNYAYSNAVRKVEIGSHIAYINSYAFAGYRTTYVSIPNDVGTIKGVFYGASALEYAAIPRKFKVFPTYMFAKCNSLRKVCVPGNLEELSANAFANCSSLEHLNLPDTLSKTYSYTWYYCKSLKKLVIPKSLTKIRASDFAGCEVLNTVVLHDGVDTIENGAFYYCELLREVVIPQNATEITSQAFYYCSSLQKVVIPETVVTIASGAFNYCQGLSELTIPKNVTSIGTYAFSAAYGIENYYFYPETPPTLTNKNTFNNISSTCIIHVPKGCLEAYQTADIWSTYAAYMVEMEEEDEETE